MPRVRHPVFPSAVPNWLGAGLVLLAAVNCAVPARSAEQRAGDRPDKLGEGDLGTAAPARSDTVYVSASPVTGQDLDPTPTLVTLVPLEQERGGADLGELLAQVAGLHIRRYGGLGMEVLPSIRGSSAAQVVVMVDGIPLADARDGSLDLSYLPVERFSRAEVYRGQVPARFGGLGGAGAINLVSRTAGAEGTSLRGYTGSFGDVGGRVLSGHRSADGDWNGSLLLHARRIDNHYRFLDHRQTLHTPDDDIERTRWNSQFEEWGGHAGGKYEGSVVATASGGVYHRQGGRPGPLGFESPHARVMATLTDGRLSLATPRQSLRLDLMATRSWEWLRDETGEVGFDPPGTTVGVSSDLLGRLTLARPRAGDGRPQRYSWQLGMDWRRQWYDEALNGKADPQRSRTVMTAFASLVLNDPAARFVLAPAVRWEMSTDDFPPVPDLPWLPEVTVAEPNRHVAVAPSISAAWSVVPDRFYLQTHAARTQRLPNWAELFGHRGGIAGNRELLPEEITTFDLGLHWVSAEGRWRQRLTLFRHWTERAIVFVQNSQRTSQARNIGASQVSGLELESTLEVPGGADLAANLTWQRARDQGDDPIYFDKELPFTPPLEVAVQLRWPLGAWRLTSSLVHEAANYRDRYNIVVERAPARTVLNLALGYTVRTGPGRSGWATTITAEMINFTDNVVYDVEGYPLPGRSFRLAVYVR